MGQSVVKLLCVCISCRRKICSHVHGNDSNLYMFFIYCYHTRYHFESVIMMGGGESCAGEVQALHYIAFPSLDDMY